MGVAAAISLISCGGGGGSDGGGSSPPPSSPPPPPPAATASLSLTLSPTETTFVDSDVNDPAAVYLGNNSAGSAQNLNVSTAARQFAVTGFVTTEATGQAGDRFANMPDESDFFRISATIDQVLTLDIRDDDLAPGDYDATTGLDLDLIVYDETGEEVVAASTSCCSPYELVLIPDDGEYVVEVNAYRSGASYALTLTDGLGVPAILPGFETELMLTSELSVEAEPVTAIGQDFAQTYDARGRAARGALLTAIDARREATLIERRTNVSASAHRLRSVTLSPQALGGGDREDKLALADLVKALNAHEGQETFRLVHGQTQHQVIPSSDPDPDPALQWNVYAMSFYSGVVQEHIDDDPPATIAVIDGGFFTSHPEIAGSIVDQRDFVPAVDFDGDGTPDDDGYDADAETVADPATPEDPDSGESCHVFHGTSVASVAAAIRGNGGMVGVYPGADLMLLRMGRETPPTCGAVFDFTEALRYAAGLDNASGETPAQPADVVNMSFGGRYPIAAQRAAVADAEAAGVFMVASAGNRGATPAGREFPEYPAAYPGVFAIGASDQGGAITEYSPIYREVDLIAPGGSDGALVLGAGAVVNAAETGFDPDYFVTAGTSIAAPAAAAAFALMNVVAPDLTPADARAFLRAGDLTTPPNNALQADAGTIDLNQMLLTAEDFAASGVAPTNPPAALTSPRLAYFDEVSRSVTMDIAKVGEGPLSVVGVTVEGLSHIEQPMILVRAEEIDADGFGTYTFYLDRGADGVGTHNENIYFELSDGSTAWARAIITTGLPYVAAARTAPITVRLERQDGEGFAFVDELAVSGLSEVETEVAFEHPGAGVYRFVYGTDIDHDGELCDAGEMCGVYPSRYASETTFTLDDQDSELNLPLTYLQAPDDATAEISFTTP